MDDCILLPEDVTSPRIAREWIATRCGSHPEAITAAQLIVSELVSNAVVHAKSEAMVSIHLDRASIHVEVEDHDPATMDVERGRTTDMAASGRGLMIVSALSTAWGVRSTTAGKAVWCDLAAGP